MQTTGTGTGTATRKQPPSNDSGGLSVIAFINAQIAKITNGLSSSVLAVSGALSMQIDEIADAYSGRCPDQSADVDPLDLDKNYVLLLDAVRVDRPKVYAALVDAVAAWNDQTPALYKQPLAMVDLTRGLLSTLGADHGACSKEVSDAVVAALSSAKAPPPPPDENGEVGTVTS